MLRHCWGRRTHKEVIKGIGKALERPAEERESRVQVRVIIQVSILSRAGHEEPCLNPRGPSRKAKYGRKTDSEPVP